jgi:hypothetical protein
MAAGKLIFVYNARSGRLNNWLDTAHKVISPTTYTCRLCDLTYDVLKEKEEWLRFRESELDKSPGHKTEFLHKDEFEKEYRSKWLPKYEYPIILEITDHGLEVILNSTQMNQIETTTTLIEEIKKRLQS